ncbi:MAG: hypothetical protein GWM88_06195 [Pseudomonadales bacterium]|nr:hypothetical protein [Pseudomonadales bacterium]NIX07614.1 hypothetical protein [Pseudomonadales bacterium]
MKRMKRAILAFTLALFMATPALAAPEDSPSAFAMTGDLVVARPLGLAMTAIGTAVFVVSLPFSALGGNVGESADTLVMGPVNETFVRCLGCRSAGRRQAPPAN